MHIYFNCKTKLILKDIQFKARSKFSLCTKKRDVYLLGTESSFRLDTVYVQINCTCKTNQICTEECWILVFKANNTKLPGK